MTSSSRILRVQQDRESPVRVVHRKTLAYRFAYARAADTRVADDVGQDYLTVLEGERTLTFALCDGVSQSFFGNLAARYLGDALVDWLSKHLPPTMDPEAFCQALTIHLRTLVGPATEAVQHHPLPTGIPQMLRDVLEEKRALGSESTFVCGRIDLPGDDFPTGRIALAWMGDSRLRLWEGDDAHAVDLGGVFETAQRWSTRRGLVGGEPNVYVAPLESAGRSIKRLMAYSDGLIALDDWNIAPPNHVVQDMITRAGEAATSDDISFLEVWLGSVPAHIEAAPSPLPAPILLEVGQRGGRVRAAWRSVPGAYRYEVEVGDGEVKSWWVPGTDWESPEMSPGDYRLRIRAWRDDTPGKWSEEHRVTVLRPVAPLTVPLKPVEPRPTVPTPSVQKSPIGVGCIGLLVVFIVLGSALAGLTLPVNGPLHRLIFRPTPTSTLAGEPVITTITVIVPTATLSPTRTLAPSQTPTVHVPLAIPSQTPTVQSPLATPTRPPTGTPTLVWTPTPVETTTHPLVGSVAPTSFPSLEESTPTETSAP